MYVKFHEVDVLFQQLRTAIAVGSLLGYFTWKLGMEKDYLLDMLGSPFNETAALSANMWLLIAVLFSQQVSETFMKIYYHHVNCKIMLSNCLSGSECTHYLSKTETLQI